MRVNCMEEINIAQVSTEIRLPHSLLMISIRTPPYSSQSPPFSLIFVSLAPIMAYSRHSVMYFSIS